VGNGKKAAVIGDGAVGLCGVIAAKQLGAEQIIIMGRHPSRIELAKAFGATDVVSARGEEAIERVRALTGGFGVHAVRCSSRGHRALRMQSRLLHGARIWCRFRSYIDHREWR
jgi:threonine dehydrogenase-like Zn-dependent dehydrogenase